MQESSNNLGDGYEVREAIKKKVFKIAGVDKDECNDKDVLLKKIISQNRQFACSDKLKIRNIVDKGEVNTVVIETQEETCNKLWDRSRVYIGFERYMVYEVKNHFIRCFKCSGFGHFAQECRNHQACPKCSMDHTLKECSVAITDYKCINCKTQNDKCGLSLNINHAAWSNECEVLRNKLKKASIGKSK